MGGALESRLARDVVTLASERALRTDRRACRRHAGRASALVGVHARSLLGALVLSGCTALGLTDGFEQAGCHECDELNFIETPPECTSWQCDESIDRCVIDLVDQDEDGAPVAICAFDERPADCDDADAANTPTGVEGCDAADNDCDGEVDEGFAFTREETSLDASVIALGPALEVAWARDSVVGLGGEALGDTGLGEVHALAVATIDGEPILAMVTGAPCDRVVPARATDGSLEVLAPWPRGEGCAIEGLTLVPFLDGAIALWTERDARSDGCATGEVIALRLDAALAPIAGPARLGSSVGNAAIAIVDDRAWVAVPREADVALLTVDAGLGATRVNETPCDGCGRVAIDVDAHLGLAYAPCGLGPVSYRRFDRRGAPVGEPLEIATAHPTALALDEGSLLAWASEAGVDVQRVDDALLGPPLPLADLRAPIAARFDEGVTVAGASANGVTLAHLACAR